MLIRLWVTQLLQLKMGTALGLNIGPENVSFPLPQPSLSFLCGPLRHLLQCKLTHQQQQGWAGVGASGSVQLERSGLEQCYPRRSGQNLFSEPLHLFWGPQCPVLTFTLPSSTHPDLIPRMTSPSNPFLSLIFSHLNSNLPLLYPRAIMSYRRPGKPAF